MSNPTPDEQHAYEVVGLVLGVPVDHQSAQPNGEVDAHLRFADGAKGALEVTTIADPGTLQVTNQLSGRRDTSLQWNWIVQITPSTRIKRF